MSVSEINLPSIEVNQLRDDKYGLQAMSVNEPASRLEFQALPYHCADEGGLSARGDHLYVCASAYLS